VTIHRVSSLEAAGFQGGEIGRRRALFQRALATLDGGPPAVALHVPGRIEVLGKHTDYAGGRSLLVATEQGFAVVAARRTDRRVRVVEAESGQAREVALEAPAPGSPGDWGNYLATVARRFAGDFGSALAGADIGFASDLPVAAGVSSSSALVIAIGLVLIELGRLDRRPEFQANLATAEDLGAYFGAVENGRPFREFGATRGVGTLGGNQDQTAIFCCRPDAVVQYRFDPVAHQRTVTFPPTHLFAIGASGVLAEKAGAAIEHYNGLARATARLGDLAAGATPEASGTLVDRLIGDPATVARVADAIEREVEDPSERQWLRGRMAQLLEECGTLIPGVADAFERSDFDALGDLVERSQRGAELGLKNQIAETIELVRLARELGADAASAFGAGFGGSVWALIERSRADRFLEQWRERYLERFPDHQAAARFLLTRPGPPAVAFEGLS
jgi:galactokinase